MRKRWHPMTLKRWQNFTANRRGYRSFQIFLILFFLSLFAELIANDKPLVVSYGDEVYFPVLFQYSEREFGGYFQTEADYRAPAVRQLIDEQDGWMLWPPIPYSYNTVDYQIQSAVPAPPSSRHLLGTDDGARDVLARLIYGFRVSVLF
ncbi:MAG: ABC transporter permease, partial [Pseudomonadales bacterium]|nr:ABC transporter permease [Pseudomonadales bacterium]